MQLQQLVAHYDYIIKLVTYQHTIRGVMRVALSILIEKFAKQQKVSASSLAFRQYPLLDKRYTRG